MQMHVDSEDTRMTHDSLTDLVLKGAAAAPDGGSAALRLISHPLCPYVQRAAIALIEKGAAFERTDVDLANKPDWFLALSPLGKTPVLLVGPQPIFESSVIVEFLEDTLPNPLHPADPLERARHRAWIEVASSVLNDIAAFYGAADAAGFAARSDALRAKFTRIEDVLGDGPYFDGGGFSLVDAAFAPVFRYFAAFDRIGDFGNLADLPKTARWRKTLAQRPSVRAAAPQDYDDLLWAFLGRRPSHLAALMVRNAAVG